MTLVVAAHGPKSNWILADRRLSYEGRPPRDDARKIMFLEASDGTAMLGYAGLGATALGTEPADWMCAVLRGRSLPIEQSLLLLARAVQQQFPRHMRRMAGGLGSLHVIVAIAYMRAPPHFRAEPRVYVVYLQAQANQADYVVRVAPFITIARTAPIIAVAGSGIRYMSARIQTARDVVRVIRAHDRGKVSPLGVADYLARLNDTVRLQDRAVGPDCIVAWRLRAGGGSHMFYRGTTRDGCHMLPGVVRGWDLTALAGIMKPLVSEEAFEARKAAGLENKLDEAKLNADLLNLPGPDKKLR